MRQNAPGYTQSERHIFWGTQRDADVRGLDFGHQDAVFRQKGEYCSLLAARAYWGSGWMLLYPNVTVKFKGVVVLFCFSASDEGVFMGEGGVRDSVRYVDARAKTLWPAYIEYACRRSHACPILSSS